MSRIPVNKNDKHRIVLTELLPFETPVIFSNHNFYSYLKHNESLEFNEQPTKGSDVVKNIFCRKAYTIPYNYRIKRGDGSYRTLSVMHPSIQVEFVDFYNKFENQIINYCGKSKSTLRAPIKVANYYYEKSISKIYEKIKDKTVELEVDAGESEPSFASTYFLYKKYSFLYKFYESREFINLEKKYKFLAIFDVSKCFASIYTHSISWATKDKQYSKKYKNQYSFDAMFDSLMQRANYNETNGIVIGPEVSRLFAEIILQRVDVNVQSDIGKKYKLIHDQHYSVRRYIDDFFVFVNEPSDVDKIVDAYQLGLEEYKLYLNDKKTIRMSHPFVTEITVAKKELSQFVSLLNFSFLGEDGEFKNVNDPIKKSAQKITELKKIIKQCNISYDSVSVIILSILRTNILKMLSAFESKSEKNIKRVEHYLVFMLQMVFFIYSMDVRVNTTYKTTQVLVYILDFLGRGYEQILPRISKMIFDECVHVAKNFSTRDSHESPELQNLLIAMRHMGDRYLLSESDLKQIINYKKFCEHGATGDADYFLIMTLLYYIRDDKRYLKIKNEIAKAILSKIQSSENLLDDTSCLLIILDSMSCPYISPMVKRSISKAVCARMHLGNNAKLIKEFKKYASSKKWFINWGLNINLGYLLQKKELKAPYER